MKKILTIFFTVLFVLAAITMAVSAATIGVDDKNIYYTNLLDFNPETNELWAEKDADGNWVAKEIGDYDQPMGENGKPCTPILTTKYSSYAARKWALSDDGEFLTITSTDSSVYPGVVFVLDAAHNGDMKVGREDNNPPKAEYVKIRVRNYSTCDQITFGWTMNHTNNGTLMPVSTSELTVDANGKKYESSGEWQTYIFSMYDINMNTNYDELLYDPANENAKPTSRWPGELYEFAIYPFGYNVTDGTGNYPGAKIDIDYVVIGSKDYVTNYQSALEEKEASIVSLELVKAPTKTNFVVGEMLSFGEFELVATFQDGHTEYITTPSASVSTFDSAETKEVVLKYGAQSVSYPVTVAPVTSIEVIEFPENQKFEVAALADGFLTDGYTIQINYEGAESRTLPNSNFVFSGDFNQAGQAEVTVYYFGKSTTFTVDLIQLVDINITPNKTYRYGNKVNIGDFDIEFVYSDGTVLKESEASIELTYNEDEIKKNTTKAPGKSKVTITATNEDYAMNFTKEVEITTEAPISVEVTKQPTKVEYQPNEKFDSKGMEVKVIYDDGDGKTKAIKVDAADYTCTVSTSTPGQKTVNIRTDIPGLSDLFKNTKLKTTITVLGDVATSTDTSASDSASASNTNSGSSSKPGSSSDFNALPIIIIVAVVVVLGGVVAVVIVIAKKKKNS